MWIEVSEGNWLNVEKVGRVWLQEAGQVGGIHVVHVTVDGESNVIFGSRELSEAQEKVRGIIDICMTMRAGRETLKQKDARPKFTIER